MTCKKHTFETIEFVEPIEPYKLRILFKEHGEKILDYSSFVNQGGLTDELSNFEIFSSVKVGSLGNSIEWANGYDIHANRAYELSS
jgi:hypothetical protein